MDQHTALTAINLGIQLWWRAIGRIEGFEHHSEDIEWVRSPGRTGPERIFNVHILTTNATGRLDEITTAMKAGALPGSMLLTPLSSPENVVALLAERGLFIDSSNPCMALELAQFHTIPAHMCISVAEVTHNDGLHAWADIVNRGLFECELFTPEQYSSLHAQGNTRWYLASLDGTPASACLTIQEGAVATLECVATLPEYRRRGLGTVVVSRALEELKARAVSIVTLRAEPDGVGLYRRLGFEERCKRVVASVS